MMYPWSSQLANYVKTGIDDPRIRWDLKAKLRPWFWLNSLHIPNVRLPEAPGVYVFLSGRHVDYVGSSGNLANRLRSYRFQIDQDISAQVYTPWCNENPNTRLICKFRLSRRYGDWLSEEARLIWKLKPMYNKKGYTLPKWRQEILEDYQRRVAAGQFDDDHEG